MSLFNEFIKKGIIANKDLFSFNKDFNDKSLDEFLLSKDVSEEKILEIKKKYFKDTPFYFFNETKIVDNSILEYIPFNSVKRYKIIPLGISEDNELEVGMLNPEDLTAKTILEFLSTKIKKPLKIYLISWKHYNFFLNSYKGIKHEVREALGEYSDIKESELKELNKKLGKNKKKNDVVSEDSPIAKIVSNLIKGAAEKKASDIHIEINNIEIIVRYRVDGIMVKNLVLPKNIHSAVVTRIKILSKIKIDEKRKPQDGRFSTKFLNRKIDFRVSTFPTYYGEKVVMRLLEQDRGTLPVSELGFSEENMLKIKKILSSSYGIVLVCGPTGSGKTNTLYSLLNEVDKETTNVVSLEDPIELNIPNVSQSQIRPNIGYTFATGLRSILRQDPDIIMIGEIRDSETASLAIEAALTGHLVFSTIHTNTASDVPQRLIDMGVEPYLIGPTLIASIGQRLIRKIIPEARVESEMPENIKKFIEQQTEGLPKSMRDKFLLKNKIYKTEVIDEFKDGMKGRTAVFEILEMNNNLKRIIIDNPSSINIFEEARRNGFVTFKEDGIRKALEGITTFEEVLKL